MRPRHRSKTRLLHASVAAALCGSAGLAQGVTANAAAPAPASSAQAAAPTPSLRQVFDAAWARQPEAQALQARRDAARARQSAAQAWTPEPAALELSGKADRLGKPAGAREYEIGIALPLWLPGERGRSVVLADAEGAAIESRANAAQLRVAATVRDAWWQWQRARIEVESARAQLDNTRVIAADVARRAKAGDLARADQHQADGAVAGAEAGWAQAAAGLAAARLQLHALAGVAGVSGTSPATPATQAAPSTPAWSVPPAPPAWSEAALTEVGMALSEPDPGTAATQADLHAALQELRDRAAVAERSAELTTSQSRANPELTLATTRDRGARGEASQQTVTLGIRIPFGSGPRSDARSASARAEAIEVQAHLALERERLAAEQQAARLRVEATRLQLTAAERRAQLAGESRGFFDKSFRLGETDLPTRLRVEAEAAEAKRQAARTRIELLAAISAWRQALGLLPL